MKQHLKTTIVGGLLLLGLVGTTLLTASSAGAAACTGSPTECAKQGVGESGGKGQGTVDTRVKDIVNLLIYVVGIIAVIMIVVGGLRYVLSGGDASGISGAKNTILYAVVGLVVAILAYAIVNFAIGAVTGSSSDPPEKATGDSLNGD